MEPTVNERAAILAIAERIDHLRAFVLERDPPGVADSASAWFRYLAELKAVEGNLHNLSSLAACLMAKECLCARFPMAPFDVAEKPQGAPGLDIEASTLDGRRVVGELKTTVPYGVVRLGAAQHQAIKKDIDKLRAATAEHKFLFVTDPATLRAVERAFGTELAGIDAV